MCYPHSPETLGPNDTILPDLVIFKTSMNYNKTKICVVTHFVLTLCRIPDVTAWEVLIIESSSLFLHIGVSTVTFMHHMSLVACLHARLKNHQLKLKGPTASINNLG